MLLAKTLSYDSQRLILAFPPLVITFFGARSAGSRLVERRPTSQTLGVHTRAHLCPKEKTWYLEEHFAQNCGPNSLPWPWPFTCAQAWLCLWHHLVDRGVSPDTGIIRVIRYHPGISAGACSWPLTSHLTPHIISKSQEPWSVCALSEVDSASLRRAVISYGGMRDSLWRSLFWPSPEWIVTGSCLTESSQTECRYDRIEVCLLTRSNFNAGSETEL